MPVSYPLHFYRRSVLECALPLACRPVDDLFCTARWGGAAGQGHMHAHMSQGFQAPAALSTCNGTLHPLLLVLRYALLYALQLLCVRLLLLGSSGQLDSLPVMVDVYRLF